MAEAVGWPDAQVRWEQLAELADSDEGWAALDHPEWGAFRLWLTDPRYTTVGLQTLLALEAAQEGTQAASGDGADAQASTDDGSPESIEAAQARLGLFRVQRLLSNIDPSTDEQLERYATADDPLGTVSAFPLEERQLWQYNQGLVGEGASSASSAPSDGRDDTTLAAVYPTGDLDIAMESDYPYVLLDAEWVAQDVLQYADEFGDYLVGDVARDMFAEQGFRGPDNEPSDALRSDDDVLAVNAVNDPPSGSLPDTAALSSLRSSWVNVPRLSTTLFVVDVSGSMVVPVPGTDKTRLQATIDAAKETLQIVPPSGEVGLWEFSTELQGGRNDGDYRELVTIGPLDEEVYGTTRYDRLVEALDGLEAENDTALHDTIVAAYRAMQEVYEPGNSHTIILLTDGRNDDDDSLSHEEMLELLVRERDVNQPIRVVSIAYGEQTDIDELAAVSEAVSGQVLASPELDNLDRLFIEALSGPGLDRT
jgi:Ca-activated chloride channel family protein